MVVLPAPDGPTRAMVIPGSATKSMASRPEERVGAVLEADSAERDLAATAVPGRRQVYGVGRVGDVRRLGPELEHLLHVDERLADLAVGEAQEVQRGVEIEQNLDRGSDIARSHPAVRRLDPGHDRHQGQADAHDRGLDRVEQSHGGVRLDRRAGVALQGDVIGGGRTLLGAERFDGLVVDEGVDADAGRGALGLVHLAPVGDAPVGDGEGQPGVDHHGRQGDNSEPPVEMGGEDDRGQDQLDGRGPEVEDEASAAGSPSSGRRGR